jgi:hypothetical protein
LLLLVVVAVVEEIQAFMGVVVVAPVDIEQEQFY